MAAKSSVNARLSELEAFAKVLREKSSEARKLQEEYESQKKEYESEKTRMDEDYDSIGIVNPEAEKLEQLKDKYLLTEDKYTLAENIVNEAKENVKQALDVIKKDAENLAKNINGEIEVDGKKLSGLDDLYNEYFQINDEYEQEKDRIINEYNEELERVAKVYNAEVERVAKEEARLNKLIATQKRRLDLLDGAEKNKVQMEIYKLEGQLAANIIDPSIPKEIDPNFPKTMTKANEKQYQEKLSVTKKYIETFYYTIESYEAYKEGYNKYAKDKLPELEGENINIYKKYIKEKKEDIEEINKSKKVLEDTEKKAGKEKAKEKAIERDKEKAKDKAEQDAKDKEAQDKLDKEKAEQDAKDKEAQDKLDKENAEQDAKDKEAQDKLDKEAKDKADQEQAAKDKETQDKLDKKLKERIELESNLRDVMYDENLDYNEYLDREAEIAEGQEEIPTFNMTHKTFDLLYKRLKDGTIVKDEKTLLYELIQDEGNYKKLGITTNAFSNKSKKILEAEAADLKTAIRDFTSSNQNFSEYINFAKYRDNKRAKYIPNDGYKAFKKLIYQGNELAVEPYIREMADFINTIQDSDLYSQKQKDIWNQQLREGLKLMDKIDMFTYGVLAQKHVKEGRNNVNQEQHSFDDDTMDFQENIQRARFKNSLNDVKADEYQDYLESEEEIVEKLNNNYPEEIADNENQQLQVQKEPSKFQTIFRSILTKLKLLKTEEQYYAEQEAKEAKMYENIETVEAVKVDVEPPNHLFNRLSGQVAREVTYTDIPNDEEEKKSEYPPK